MNIYKYIDQLDKNKKVTKKQALFMLEKVIENRQIFYDSYDKIEDIAFKADICLPDFLYDDKPIPCEKMEFKIYLENLE